MKDYPDIDNGFNLEEIRYIAHKWYFWKGLFIGAIGMLIGLLALGLYVNY